MKFFIDSAILSEIEIAADTGLIDGVTTNPSLIAKSGQKFEDVIKKIADLVDGPISAEVTEMDSKGMIKQGQALSKLHKNITIKLPLNVEGLKACQFFTQEGIQTNVTLCFSANQALLAAKAGATFVSPFIGRLDDIGQEGMKLISDIREIYDQYGFETQILAASIRHPEHVLRAALLGADVATLPTKIFMQLFKHPLTDKGLEDFMKDWNQSQTK